MVTKLTNRQIGAIATAIGIVGGATALGVAYSKAKKKRRTRRKTARKRVSRNKTRRLRRTPRTAGKRKDTSHKRIRYTKKGQPYVIMASGKARFISMKSAKTSRRRKGGRY